MKLLALVGSKRYGNSIFSSKYIAKKIGAELEIVNLANSKIEPCKACYACLFGEECKIEDDVYGILGKIEESDAILISSPVYWLDATGKVKLFLDRCFMAYPYLEKFKDKKGAVVYFYGFEELRGWASTTYNLLLRCMGIEPLIVAPVHSPLPGEVFEKVEILDKVAEALKSGEKFVFNGQCPVCLSESFRYTSAFECAICGSKLNEKLEVIEKGERLSYKWMIEHYEELKRFKEHYLQKRGELKKLVERYVGEGN